MRSNSMGSSAVAYDLERFQARPRKQANKPRLVVAKPGAAARARTRMATMFKLASTLALTALIIVTMLYSRAVLTELNQKVNAAHSELDEVKSENTRLQAELESTISLRNVEEYATQRLGMSAMDKSQVTFVDLSDGDQFELTNKSPKQTLGDRIRLVLSNMQEYIPEE